MSVLPTLRQLRYLVELAERLNFRQAADALFVTQSTLSAGDQGTGKRPGRGTGRARPAHGPAHARWARGGGARAGSARGGGGPRRCGEGRRRTAGGLRAARRHPDHRALSPADHPAAPARQVPRAAPVPARGPDRTTARALEAGQLDFALLALPYDTGKLVVRTLFQDEFWYVAREDDPDRQARAVRVAGSRSRPHPAAGGRSLPARPRDHGVRARGRSIAPEFEATSLPTLVQMVEGGLGVTLLPEMTVKAGILRGTKLLARPFAGRAPGAHHRARRHAQRRRSSATSTCWRI